MPKKEYFTLQKKAALKAKTDKFFSLEETRQHSKNLIREWAKEVKK